MRAHSGLADRAPPGLLSLVPRQAAVPGQKSTPRGLEAHGENRRIFDDRLARDDGRVGTEEFGTVAPSMETYELVGVPGH